MLYFRTHIDSLDDNECIVTYHAWNGKHERTIPWIENFTYNNGRYLWDLMLMLFRYLH